MDTVKIGKAIRILREKAGYTQRALAEQLLVSDKAVSKWERGLGLPDISCLQKLSVLLDTDTDTLLSGEAIQHGREWGGLLYLSVPAELGAPVFDKPLSDYLLSYFLLAGIRQIGVVCCREDQLFLEQHLRTGADTLGIHMWYLENGASAAAWAAQFENCMVLTEPLFLYGVDMTSFFLRAMMDRPRSVQLCAPMGETCPFPPVVFDDAKKQIPPAEAERPARYRYGALPLWFVPGHRASAVLQGAVAAPTYVQPLNRGFIALSLTSPEARAMAAEFTSLVQTATGMPLCDLSEIARHRQLI